MHVLGRYLASDALEHTVHAAHGETLEIGNKSGSPFADDPFVARYHAALIPGPQGVTVEDYGTDNGVYVRVRGRRPLPSPTRLRIGRQLLAFETVPATSAATTSAGARVASPNPGYWGRLSILLEDGTSAATVAFDGDDVSVGSEPTCALTIRNDDCTAALHCAVARADASPTICDHNAPHGTWIAVRSGTVVAYGAELLIGDTRVRLDRA